MGIGLTEGLLIAAIALLFFGGKKIPQLGKTLGESMKNFKAGLKNEEVEQDSKGIPPFKDDLGPKLISKNNEEDPKKKS